MLTCGFILAIKTLIIILLLNMISAYSLDNKYFAIIAIGNKYKSKSSRV
jgi:hypothetical protein